jgi:predicted transcriptional regulator
MSKFLSFATAEVESLSEDDQERAAQAMLDEAKRAAVEEGVKAAEEGRTVSHGKVKSWLKSWGSDKETSPPECK